MGAGGRRAQVQTDSMCAAQGEVKRYLGLTLPSLSHLLMRLPPTKVTKKLSGTWRKKTLPRIQSRAWGRREGRGGKGAEFKPTKDQQREVTPMTSYLKAPQIHKL